MGNSQSNIVVNFEDTVHAASNKGRFLIITTLPNDGGGLIEGTVDPEREVVEIERLISTNLDIRIIVYGANATDRSVVAKQSQLSGLGFSNVSIYAGGIFEWLLLQDVYGIESFPTTKPTIDMLKYKGSRTF